MLGLWFMQRWAVYAYVGLVFFNQGYLTQQGEWNALLLIPQGLIMVLALAYVDPYARALARQLVRWLKHQLWGLTVAYMVGIHNFWKEDDTTPDEIGLQDEVIEVQRDTGDKD
ncbi:MAG TPA: hypothetical protein DCR93_23800 [Cytophagales bacterium]|nr:hypothetical protein [Cytophagales bacterium]